LVDVRNSILRKIEIRKPSGQLRERKSKPLNAVEIEEAVSNLAEQPFDVQEFPYAFLEAFGNKATTIKRLRAGTSNKSDRHGHNCPNGRESRHQEFSCERYASHRAFS